MKKVLMHYPALQTRYKQSLKLWETQKKVL